jgi:hypothetical protein
VFFLFLYLDVIMMMHVDWSVLGTHVFSEPYEITIHTTKTYSYGTT